MAAQYRMKGSAPAAAAPAATPDLTPDSFMASQQPATSPAAITPDSFMAQQSSTTIPPAAAQPSAPWRFIQSFGSAIGAPEKASDIIEGPKYAVQHPIDSAELVGSSILNAQGSLAQRAKREFQGGDYVHAARHGLEYMIPFFGPALAKAGDQLEGGDIAGGIGTTAGVGTSLLGPEAIAKGSMAAKDVVAPALQRSAESGYSKFLNPTTKQNKFATRQIVPELLDRRVTATSPGSLASRAAANAEPIGADIGNAIDALPPFQKPPITAPWRMLPAAPTEVPLAASGPGKMPGALQPAGTPPIPESAFSPESRIAAGDSGIPAIRLTDATEPSAPWRYSTTGPRAGTAELPPAPQSEQGVMVTRDPAIANQFQTPTAKPLPKQAQAVLNRLESYKNGATVDGVQVDDATVANAGKLQDIIRELGPDVSPQSLNRVRQIWDSKVAQGGGYLGKTLSEGSMLDAQREGANAIRGVLAADNPDLAKLNAEFHFWRQVGDVAGATAERQTGQQGPLARIFSPMLGAGAALAHGGGTAEAIGTAAVMSAANEVIHSPYFRTFSAVQKARLADAISSMDVPTIKAMARPAVETGAATGSTKKWKRVSAVASANP